MLALALPAVGVVVAVSVVVAVVGIDFQAAGHYELESPAWAFPNPAGRSKTKGINFEDCERQLANIID